MHQPAARGWSLANYYAIFKGRERCRKRNTMYNTNMPIPTTPELAHIEITPDVCGGQPRLAGTRIRVKDVVVWYERMRLSADEIASRHPQASLAAIYAALTYYHDHRAEIDEQMQRGDELVEELRRAYPSKLAAKLHAGT
jgi:uncharacterized protein (DUF433 family)